MALVYNNKEYRNLQQQVKKNMDDISFILQEEGVLNEFGIKVVGQEASVIDMPTVADYKEDNPEWSYGDAFAIGTEEPYELYILTRANGTHPNDYWFNIGEFPAPGPQGPEGPQGEVGPQGPTGNPGANGISPQLGVGNVVVETLESDQDATVAITESGTQANPIWNFNFGIPKGQDGSAVIAVEWGQISGTLSAQTDLLSALQAKANASALASYATQVYANNVASNATYQANVYTDSQLSEYAKLSASVNSFTGDLDVGGDLSLVGYIKQPVSGGHINVFELPSESGKLALVSEIPDLYGYAKESWVSANFLSIGTPVGGSAVWGSISGTLSDQTDLMSKFSEYATISALNSAVSNLETYADNVGLVQKGYTDDSIIALSSIYATKSEIPSLSGYATESWVSAQGYLTSVPSEYATISQVSSAISALDYASVGALSSETYIPRVGGDNDGTYWTAITLGDDTYDIPQGGSVAWGSISGTLSNQTDLQTALDNKVDKEVTVGDDSSYIDINETAIGLYVDGLGENDEPVGSSLETSKDGVVIQANNTEGQSTQLIVSDGSVTITRDSDSASIDLFDLASMSYVDDSISALSSVYQPIGSYATVSALSSAVSDINNTISGLSSVYAPLSDYASQAWVSANFLSSGYIPVVSGYAELSASNTFTGSNNFQSTIYARNIYPSGTLKRLGSSTQAWASIYVNDLYGSDNVSKPVSQIAMLSDIPSLSGYATESWVSSNFLSNGWTPTISGYAELSANNTFTDINVFSSDTYFGSLASLGGKGISIELSNNVASFKSVDILLSQPLGQIGGSTITFLDANDRFGKLYYTAGIGLPPHLRLINNYGYIDLVAPSGIYASTSTGSATMNIETWTFTLSDNTTVSKTILVG